METMANDIRARSAMRGGLLLALVSAVSFGLSGSSPLLTKSTAARSDATVSWANNTLTAYTEAPIVIGHGDDGR